jgi:putative MATE family efflux protein
MTNRRTDFSEGSIAKHLVTFSLPMFLGNLLQALYNTVDSIWVGRFLGPASLGAVSVSFPIVFSLVALVLGLTMASNVMVAQYYGAKDHNMVKKTVANTVTVLSLSALILTVVGIVLTPAMLRLINTPADIMDEAVSYLRIFLSGMLFVFLYNGASGIMRGLGDSRTPLRFLFVATVVNIVLDPLLIFGIGPFPAMGVAGAALATVIAQGVSFALVALYLRKAEDLLPDTKEQWQFDGRIIKDMFRIGLPSGVQQLLVSLGGLTITSIVNSFGTATTAAYGAAVRLDQFAFMPTMSVGLAVSALTGQNLGAGKEERVKDVVKAGLQLSITITAVVSLIAVLFPKVLLVLFTKDQAVLEVGSQYLRIVGLSYAAFAAMFVFTGVLRGAGDTIPTMFITLTSLWLVRVPLAKLLSSIPALGVNGIWMGVALSPLAGLLVSYLYYRTGKWKSKAVTKKKYEPDLQ